MARYTAVLLIKEKNSTMRWNLRTEATRANLVVTLFLLLAATVSVAATAPTLTWTKLQPGKALPARTSFATAYDPVSQRVVIFGGTDASGRQLNETWIFDGTTWAQVTTATAPGRGWRLPWPTTVSLTRSFCSAVSSA